MFFNKTNQIISLLNEHTSVVLKCFETYREIFDKIITLTDHSNNESLTLKLKMLEKDADNKRHEVIVELLHGGFLADSRKSTMHLVEGVDLVANINEDIIQMLVFENIKVEEFLIEPLKAVNTITYKQLVKFIDVLSKIVTKYELQSIIEELHDIEAFESEVDVIEDELIKELYSKDMPLANKLQYKQLIKLITSMSDIIEDLSDEVEIILASRRV